LTGWSNTGVFSFPSGRCQPNFDLSPLRCARRSVRRLFSLYLKLVFLAFCFSSPFPLDVHRLRSFPDQRLPSGFPISIFIGYFSPSDPSVLHPPDFFYLEAPVRPPLLHTNASERPRQGLLNSVVFTVLKPPLLHTVPPRFGPLASFQFRGVNQGESPSCPLPFPPPPRPPLHSSGSPSLTPSPLKMISATLASTTRLYLFSLRAPVLSCLRHSSLPVSSSTFPPFLSFRAKLPC